MRQIAVFVALVLFGVVGSYAQDAGWMRIYSKEYHFVAEFPEQPKESSGEIETRYGKAQSKRWIVERPGILFEISVSEFSDLSIKDSRSLNQIYENICADLDGKCSGGGGDIQFGTLGRSWGARTAQKDSVSLLMYLARNKFYLVKAVVSNSLIKIEQTGKDVRKFEDAFLFSHVIDGENKFTWGLPASASQKIESKR